MKNLVTKNIKCADVWGSGRKIKYKNELVVEHCLKSDAEEISMYVHNCNDDDDIFISMDKEKAEKLIKVLTKITVKRM